MGAGETTPLPASTDGSGKVVKAIEGLKEAMSGPQRLEGTLHVPGKGNSKIVGRKAKAGGG